MKKDFTAYRILGLHLTSGTLDMQFHGLLACTVSDGKTDVNLINGSLYVVFFGCFQNFSYSFAYNCMSVGLAGDLCVFPI